MNSPPHHTHSLTSLFFSALDCSAAEPEPYFWFRWARMAAWTDGSLAWNTHTVQLVSGAETVQSDEEVKLKLTLDTMVGLHCLRVKGSICWFLEFCPSA